MARSAGPNKSRESIALLHAARNCNAKDGAERKGGREGGSWASFEEAVLPPSIERQEKRRERLLRVTELKRKNERERARACVV